MNKKLQRKIGNAFMAFSFLGLVFIYYPVAKVYFFPQQVTQSQIEDSRFSIIIPSIKAYASIEKNVDPFNEKLYLEVLKKGVAHAKGTSLPGEAGTSFLFAHSSDVPWRMTRENTAFYKLSKVNLQDEIIIRRDGKKYTYKVTDKKTVWPSEVEYLLKPQGDVLILQTCTPVGTSLKRLLVFAKEVKH